MQSELEIKSLRLSGIKLLRPRTYADRRGTFSELYSRRTFAAAGLSLDFVQDNYSVSAAAGTVRGLHYQAAPWAQDKLIRVLRGRILDVAVDLRRSSPTFLNWTSIELSADDGSQLLIPVGFAHGFCTLEPDTHVLYKVTNFYTPAHEYGIRWNDPDLAIAWPVSEDRAIVSEKDVMLPPAQHVQHWF